MNTKTALVVAFVVIGYVTIRVTVINRESGQQAASQAMKAERARTPERTREQPRVAGPTVVETAIPEPSPPEKASAPSMPQVKPDSHAGRPRTSATVEAFPAPRITDPAVKEQLGRLALSFAGADADADEVWAWLINDPDLSAHARQDLIEDLNEEGFDDPRNLTEDDLPLIESRLLLIEEHAPYAMDEVNADAFAEAYKDLINMWLRLTRP